MSFMRKPFVAGNWKMNTDSNTSVELAKAVAAGASDIAGDAVHIAVCPPFVYLQSVIEALSKSGIAVGAQDIYYEQEGAFTGEISPSMLKEIGCNYVLCGHSHFLVLTVQPFFVLLANISTLLPGHSSSTNS